MIEEKSPLGRIRVVLIGTKSGVGVFVRDASAAGDELSAGAVTVAIRDGAVRIVVVRHRDYISFVPMIRQEVVSRLPDSFIETRTYTSAEKYNLQL